MVASTIGEYLRARRELVRPQDVGLADNGRRRVPGLRRDELAMLAGISTEYYTRLEQGRDHHPSAQVLDAVARALGLEEQATAYLHGLARPAGRRRRSPRRTERVRPSIQEMIDSWPGSGAYASCPCAVRRSAAGGPGTMSATSPAAAPTTCDTRRSASWN
jgi:transcriptional regulator with XRE-family HTH domain